MPEETEEITRAMREEATAQYQLEQAGYVVQIYAHEEQPIHVYHPQKYESGRFWTFIAAWRCWQEWHKVW